MNPTYLALCLLTVTLHVSVPMPKAQDHKYYGLNTCTGVFISPNEILTAGHCVKESRGHQWIKTEENESYSVTVEKLDVKKDLALLKVTKPINHAYVMLGSPAKITDYIFTVNSGDDYEKTYNKGIVNNLVPDEDTGTLLILHNAGILSGASGSGLFNTHNELVGINVMQVRMLSQAVDIYEIKTFLNRR
jgi:S1-C subfamily serine protease